ncbi:MAG TPA: PDGLE domain-containing protein [Actinomycetota bacterium]|nr:PDGLE domain-containing protein [Actinomycetota bacterium]
MDRTSLWLVIVGGLLVALALAFVVSPYASGDPDGLDKVATDAGFADAEQDHGTADGPLAGYEVEGVDDASLSTGVAGVVGVVLTFGLGMLLFGVLRTRARRAEDRVEAGP